MKPLCDVTWKGSSEQDSADFLMNSYRFVSHFMYSFCQFALSCCKKMLSPAKSMHLGVFSDDLMLSFFYYCLLLPGIISKTGSIHRY